MKTKPKKTKVSKTLMQYRVMGVALGELRKERLSARLAYSINSMARAINDVLEPFNDSLKELGKRFEATFTDSGFTVPPENLDAFNEEAKELGEVEREIEVYPIELPPDMEFDGACDVLDVLEGLVSIKGLNLEEDEPEQDRVSLVE